jgi:hypothetical protein
VYFFLRSTRSSCSLHLSLLILNTPFNQKLLNYAPQKISIVTIYETAITVAAAGDCLAVLDDLCYSWQL